MLSFISVAADSEKRRMGAPTPGERVRAARLRRSLTRETLAAEAGKHVNTIANMEDDKTPPALTARGWRTVSDVATVLKTTPEALGYRLKRFVRNKRVSERQREVIDEILALSPADLERVHRILRELDLELQKHLDAHSQKGRSEDGKA